MNDVDEEDDNGRFQGYFGGIRVGDDLTRREIEVLTYYSRGLTRPQVASALFIGDETVKTHAMTARYKLRAKTTTHACCEAIRRGLIR